jgi:hypothetical protein
MSNVTYYVAIGFDQNEDGELIGTEPLEASSSHAAIARARSLGSTKAGALAFSRTGNPETGDFADAVVLFSTGEVPDEVPVS